MAWHKVASKSELDDEEVIGVEVEETQIAIYRLGDAFYATSNICTHAFAFLSDGYIEDDCVECPLHQQLFRIATGEAVEGPAEEDLKTFPVKVEGDDILVEV
ncbi:MAG: non-heme iron oxygenase ferredoxin subunit [Rhodovibrionaceae bacterium]